MIMYVAVLMVSPEIIATNVKIPALQILAKLEANVGSKDMTSSVSVLQQEMEDIASKKKGMHVQEILVKMEDLVGKVLMEVASSVCVDRGIEETNARYSQILADQILVSTEDYV